jgi:hypothetical protein
MWEEYGVVLDNCAKILGFEYGKEKEIESLTLLGDLMADIPVERKQDIAKELYNWLLSHKPKFLRDGIMHELSIVEAKYMSQDLKEMMSLWCEIQELILYKTELPVLLEEVSSCNNPKKVFDDYKVFITDFKAILNA